MRVILIAVIILFAHVVPTRADMVDDCVQEIDKALRIEACTAAIESGRWKGKNLAWAHNNRGSAFDDLKRYEEALLDHNRALELDPGDPDTLFNRANTYCSLGRTQPATDGYLRAAGLSKRVAQDMQAFLADAGVYSGKVDGRFGPKSRSALEDWAGRACR